jgi:DNA-binding transcriptional MocR family regulator
MAVTKAGDTIAVESPVYFGLLQLANTLGLRVIELPTDPVLGMDIEALREALKNNKIKAVAVISNFNNPMGNIMSDDNKKVLVSLIQQYEIPLIEDDIYGDIYFGKSRPTTCKTFDDSGLVMLCGSFSKTLAGGYRIGRVVPGRFKAEVMRLKLYLSAATTTITEEAMAIFLEKGRYDHHLRKLRQTLYTNSLKYLGAIGRYFPEGTRVSKPKGSFLIWVELHENIDTRMLYEKAESSQIRFSPGRIFTLQDQYNNCMRLSYGMVWNEDIDLALRELGQLAKDMIGR